MNINYFLIYERDENVRFVSHLDFVRCFGRAMRRGKIPIAFSEGFNPHPLMVFALPLPVGYTSECELLEFELSEEMDETVIKDTLNSVIPIGITVKSVTKGKSNMKRLDNALYIVTPENMPYSMENQTSRQTALQ